MTLLEFKHKLHSDLKSLYPKNEINSFFKLLIEDQLNYSSVDAALHPNTKVPLKELSFLLNAIEKLQKEEPIQYILGKTEFYGLSFQVNQHTLIPRPETEELVDWVLQVANTYYKNKEIRILDIGTGSGCIAISLAKNLPNAQIYAIDKSKNAIDLAKKNARLNKTTVHFIEADILKVLRLSTLTPTNSSFDIIVSNPPYVRDIEKKEMQVNVLKYEPHQALFVTNTKPLIFYEKIAELAALDLSKDGCLFFEINQYLHSETADLLKKQFTEIELKKDLFDNFRMIKASF